MKKKTKNSFVNGLTAAALGAIVSGVLYLMVRTVIFMSLSGTWQEKALGFLLLGAEVFILIHGAGYAFQILRVSKRGEEEPPPQTYEEPPVAVVVSAYREPLDVVERTLVSFYNLNYSNKHLYLLDDTRYEREPPGSGYREAVNALAERTGVGLFRRKWHGAKAGMLNDFLDFTAGRIRPDFEFTGASGEKRPVDFKYLVIFDADQTPFPNFLKDLVARMEAESDLAFIQTPQYYTNFRKNRVARASGLQQAVFYEFICEGKATRDAMFCCGTNVIFRRAALEDIGGIEEHSVTEDFATSLKIHARGWRSAYSSKVQAFGLGPEDLGGYLKQQFRWALGTIGMFRVLLGKFLRRPKMISPVKWWEYFLSSTYYFVGWAFLVLAVCPVLFLIFDVPSYFAYPSMFMLFFLPYLGVTLAVFFWTLRRRNYSPGDIMLGQLLVPAAFPVYLKASVFGLLNIKSSFVVTPKEGSRTLPLSSLWMQLGLASLNIAAIVWGLHRLFYENPPFWGIAINIFWCSYHFAILSSVLYLNDPEKNPEEKTAPS